MAINSKQKGARGEREFAGWLRDNFGVEARRSQQFCGRPESSDSAGVPDVVCNDLPDVHFEVKAVEKLNVHKALSQAQRDAHDKIPVVAHKKNRTPWLLTLKADDLKRLVHSVAKLIDD